MPDTFKCPNCGAGLTMDRIKNTKRCANCGFTIDLSDNDYSFARHAMNFSEQVRQKKVNEAIQQEKRDNKLTAMGFIVMGLIAVMLFLALWIPHSNSVRKIERLIEEVQTDILNENYGAAALKIPQIRIENGWSEEETKKYDDIRKDLEKLLKEKTKKGWFW